jgi:mannose-1-phosphate guanylyltransferase
MKRTAIIMAGGSGERFWPLSRKSKPKQLLPLASEKPMIQESIERISDVIDPEDIFIITGSLLLEPIRKALPMLPPENIVAEPYKRNTAPCLALGAAFIAAKYAGEFKPNEISIAVLTADQKISPKESFAKDSR